MGTTALGSTSSAISFTGRPGGDSIEDKRNLDTTRSLERSKNILERNSQEVLDYLEPFKSGNTGSVVSGIEKPNKEDINRFSGKLILTGSTTIEQNLRDTIDTGTSGRLKPTVHANKSFNLLPSPTGVANSRENSQTRLRENIVSGEFDDFMRRTLRNPSSFPMEGVDETKPGVGLRNN